MTFDPNLTLDERLAQICVEYRQKPRSFVRVIYPWGAPGTELANEAGPDKWQDDVMAVIEDYYASGKYKTESLQIAVASGNGVGKGALAAWLVHWFNSCFKNPRIVVTANTATQLDTKTWREVALWQTRALNGHWFVWTATKYYRQNEQKTWYASAIPWNEQKPEAFAGTHGQATLFIFDEGSSIADTIWEASEGAFTEPNSIWIVLGNPTRNVGRFRECFGRLMHRWHRFQLVIRTCKMSSRNLTKFKQWVEDYGEDSDFVRVHGLGQFPRAASTQFIGNDLVNAAVGREYDLREMAYSPICVGCDVARFGDDQTVMQVRRGLKIIHTEKYRELDTMQVASRLVAVENKWRGNILFVDVVCRGRGGLDRRLPHGRLWIGVQNGVRASDTRKYANKRAEMWDLMKEWLANADIPNDQELINDLLGPEYGYNKREQIQLERKEDMKSRGLSSPDCADALAITFAERLGARLESDEDSFSLEQQHKAPDSDTGY